MASERNFRDIFNGLAGTILQEFVTTPEQIKEIVALQIRLTAIINADKGAEIGGIKSIEAAEGYIRDKGLAVDIEHATVIVNSGKGVPRGVPRFGDLAVSMEFVEHDLMETLMLAQAAERTLQAAELLADKSFTLRQTQASLAGETVDMITRPWIKQDSSITTRAQNIQHLADIIGGLVLCGKTTDKITNAHNALKSAGAVLYQHAATALAKSGNEALVKGVQEVLDGLEEKGSSLAVIMPIIKAACEDIKTLGFKSSAFKDVLNGAVEKRLEGCTPSQEAGESKSV